MANEFFTPGASANMDRFLKERRNQTVRQAGRGLAAGIIGFNKGAEAGVKYLDEHQSNSYERDRARFMEEQKLKLEYLALQQQVENDVRTDNTKRWGAEVDANLDILQQRSEDAQHFATVNSGADARDLAHRTKADEAWYDAQVNGNDTVTAMRGDLEDIEQELMASLGVGGSGGGGRGSGGSSGGSAYVMSDPFAAGLSAEDINHGIAAEQVQLLNRGEPMDSEDSNRVLPALKLLHDMKAGTVDRVAGMQQLTMMGYDPASLEQYSTAIIEGDPKKLAPPLQGALTSGAGTSTQLQGVTSTSSFLSNNWGTLMSADDATLNQLAVDGSLTPEQLTTVAGHKTRILNAMVRNMAALGQTGEDAATVRANRLAMAKTASKYGMTPQEFWDFAGSRMGTSFGDFATENATQSQVSEEGLKERYARTGSQAAAVRARRYGHKVDDTGVLDALANGGTYVMENGELPPAEVASATGAREAEEAAEAGGPAPVAAESEGAIDQQRAAEANAAAEAEAEQAQLDADGNARLMGLTLRGDSIPATTAGQIDLALQLMEEYPKHPPLQEFKNALMEGDEIQEFARKRGYQNADPEWLFKQFTQEYRYHKWKNQQTNEQKAREHARVGTSGAQDEGWLGADDTEGRGTAQARRLFLRGKRQGERTSFKAQGEAVGAQIGAARARAELPPEEGAEPAAEPEAPKGLLGKLRQGLKRKRGSSKA